MNGYSTKYFAIVQNIFMKIDQKLFFVFKPLNSYNIS